MNCEGYIREGGAFTFGPVRWKQCQNDATVRIKFFYPGEEIQVLPSCNECWQRCLDEKDIKVVSVLPIVKE